MSSPLRSATGGNASTLASATKAIKPDEGGASSEGSLKVGKENIPPSAAGLEAASSKDQADSRDNAASPEDQPEASPEVVTLTLPALSEEELAEILELSRRRCSSPTDSEPPELISRPATPEILVMNSRAPSPIGGEVHLETEFDAALLQALLLVQLRMGRLPDA